MICCVRKKEARVSFWGKNEVLLVLQSTANSYCLAFNH